MEISKEKSFLDAVRSGDVEKVVALLEQGVYIGTRTEEDNTPLIEACSNGTSQVALALIENGANVNAKNKFGISPLLYASCNGLIDVVTSLIHNGADVNASTPEFGNGIGFHCATALHFAAIYDHPEIASILLLNGADMNMINKEGKTPLYMAFGGNHTRTVEVIRSHAKRQRANAVTAIPGASALRKPETLATIKSNFEKQLKEMKDEFNLKITHLQGQLEENETRIARKYENELQRTNQKLEEHQIKINQLESELDQYERKGAVGFGLQNSISAPSQSNGAETRDDEFVEEQHGANKKVQLLDTRVKQLEQESLLDTLEIIGLPYRENEDLDRIAASIESYLSGFSTPTHPGLRVHRRTSIDGGKSDVIELKFPTVNLAKYWLKCFRKHPIEKKPCEIIASSLGPLQYLGDPEPQPHIPYGDNKVIIRQKLTSYNKKLLHRTKEFAKEKGYKFVWIQDGKILLRKNENGPIIRIKCTADLPNE